MLQADGVEVWAVGQAAAYRLHLPRLYGRVVPGKCIIKVNSQRQKVYLLLYKLCDAPWPFIKG